MPPTSTPMPGRLLYWGWPRSRIITKRSGAASIRACMPAHMPAPPDTVSKAKYDVTNPPITRKTTWMTSVQDTALNPPYKL